MAADLRTLPAGATSGEEGEGVNKEPNPKDRCEEKSKEEAKERRREPSEAEGELTTVNRALKSPEDPYAEPPGRADHLGSHLQAACVLRRRVSAFTAVFSN